VPVVWRAKGSWYTGWLGDSGGVFDTLTWAFVFSGWSTKKEELGLRFEVYESKIQDGKRPSMVVNVFFSDVVQTHEPGTIEDYVAFSFYQHGSGANVSYGSGSVVTTFDLDKSGRDLMAKAVKLIHRLERVKEACFLSDLVIFLQALKRIGYKPCAYNPHTRRYHDLDIWPRIACYSAETLGTEIRVLAEDRQEARTLIRLEWEARLQAASPTGRIHQHHTQWEIAGRQIIAHGIHPLYVAPQLAEAGFKVPTQTALAV